MMCRLMLLFTYCTYPQGPGSTKTRLANNEFGADRASNIPRTWSTPLDLDGAGDDDDELAPSQQEQRDDQTPKNTRHTPPSATSTVTRRTFKRSPSDSGLPGAVYQSQVRNWHVVLEDSV